MSKDKKSDRKAGFGYFLREGLTSAFVHGFTSFAAMLVIAACLMITGTFSLVAYNLDLQIRELEGKSEIVIYIDETVSREDAQAMGNRIRAIPNVKQPTSSPKSSCLRIIWTRWAMMPTSWKNCGRTIRCGTAIRSPCMT